MARYLLQVSYTQAGVQGLMKEGATARKEFIDKMIANLGGTLESFHFAFGDADVIAIAELPDEATAAAISMAVGAAGVAAVKTTVLSTRRPSTPQRRKRPATGHPARRSRECAALSAA